MNKISALRLLLIIFLALLNCSVYSQADKEFEQLRAKYIDEEEIFTNLTYYLEINIIGGVPNITYTRAEELLFFEESNSGYNKRSVSSSTFFELINKEVYHLRPTGKGYKKTKITDFQLNDFSNRETFYDDSKEYQFRFPNLEKGDKTYIKTTHRLNDPALLPKAYFSPFTSYHNVDIQLKVPADLELGISPLRIEDTGLKFEELKAGKFKIYKWSGSITKRYNFESDGPPSEYIAPIILFRIISYYNGKEKVTVLGNNSDFYTWNCKFAKERIIPDSEFKSFTDSITVGVENKLEKARLIYEWVLDNIRYIAIEYGYGGYRPEDPREVLSHRYGDCKGMSNLLMHMLKSQGMEAYLTWIGTRDLPYTFQDMAMNSTCNHMVTAFPWNDSIYILDGTASNNPFLLPAPAIQGKQALIGISKCDNFRIFDVPVLSAEDNNIWDSCFIEIKGRNIEGSGTVKLNAFRRMYFINSYNVSDYNGMLKFCRAFLLKGSNRFMLDTVWFENFNEKSKPLIINYKFSIPEYAVQIDGDYFINMNLQLFKSYQPIKENRNVALNFKFHFANYTKVVLKIPEKLKVEFMPESSESNSPLFGFSNRYAVSGDNLIMEQASIQRVMLLEVENFKEYNNYIFNKQKTFNEQIHLLTK